MTGQKFTNRILSAMVLICMGMCIYLGQHTDGKKSSADDQDPENDRRGVFYLEAGPNAQMAYFEPSKTDIGDEEEIKIVMVGDMLMHDAVLDSGKNEDGTYNYDGLFAHVTDYVKKSDIAIVNQETILGGVDLGLSGYPSFNSPYEVGESEINSGFNVILHATNHAYDKGKRGIDNTIAFWEKNHPDIPYLGINSSQDHKNRFLCIYEKDGIRVAILNYTFGTNGGRIPVGESYLVNYLDEEKVISDLKKARERADFVIVCPHWGTEYQLAENTYQMKWTNLFFDHGADLVLGAHPHVIQPIKWVTDEHGRDMLVYYSLGNFVNGTNRQGTDVLQRIIGGMADVTIGRDEDGEVKIRDYGVRPLICHYDKSGQYTTYFLEEYDDSLLKENGYMDHIPGLSMDKCWSYVDHIWGNYFSANLP